MIKKVKAFTIIEVLVVITVIGLLAAISLPGYQKAIRKGHERTAITNLMAIRTGLEFYLANQGSAPDPNWTNLNAINTALGLRIADPLLTYRCWAFDSPDTNTCRATHPGGWILHFHEEHSGGSIHCLSGACPSCPLEPENCEG